MDENRKKILDKIAKIIAESGEFKDFHGNIQLNFSYGQHKNSMINQSILPEKAK